MGIVKSTNMSAAIALRSVKELSLPGKSVEAVLTCTEAETGRLLHELQIHQIELELQNAELRSARDEMEAMQASLAKHSAELEAAYRTGGF